MGAAAVTVRARGRATMLARLWRRLPRSSWGLADQAVISATNFVTMILLARVLSPAGFGAFTLLYTTLLFTGGLHGTVITQAHNIIGLGLGRSEYRRYTGSTGATHLAFAALTGGAVLTAAAVAGVAGSSVAPLLLALAAATVAWLTQEFVRRVLYTEVRLFAAFVNDLISYAGQAVAIAALWQLGSLTAATALYALAVTSTLAVVVGAWQTRRSFARAFDRADVRANWDFGKWLAGAFVAYWFSSQLYLYLAALLLGTAATGTLKAALVVMGPLNVLLLFVDTTTPILLARTLDSGGDRAMHEQLKLTAVRLAPVVGGYCLVAGVFAGPLLGLFYGSRYANGTAVLALFAVHYVVIATTRLLSAAIRARQLTKWVFKANLYSGLFAVAAGWLIIEAGGVLGAAAGMIAGALITAIVLLHGYTGSRTQGPAEKALLGAGAP